MQKLPTGLRLDPESGFYHHRRGVPKDLKDHPAYRDPRTGKEKTDAFRESLRTRDRDEACARASEINAKVEREFAAIRASKREPAPTTITPAIAKYVADETRRMILEAEENVTFYSDNAEQRRLACDAFASAKRASLEALRGGDLEIAKGYAQRITDTLGIKVNWETPEGRKCLIETGRAIMAAWLDLDERYLGKLVPTPDAPEKPEISTEPVEPPKTLRDVVPSWERLTNAKADAKKRMTRALNLFEEAVGVRPLADLTKRVGAQFLDFMLDSEAREFMPKTAHNYTSAIMALMNVAAKVDLIERNPFDLTFDKTVGSKKRYPWTDAELDRLFSHRLFSDQMDTVPSWRNVTPRDARAALLILMHTGARIGEVAQLRRQDFQTRSGVKGFQVTAEAGTVKTKESDRFVALASHLQADPWFAEWHSGLEGTGKAFPSLHGRDSKGPGDMLIQWFAIFREDAGLPAGALEGSHKFRHWIRTALAALDVVVTTQDAITGHESKKGSSGTIHYTHTASAETILKALDKVEWPKISV